MKTLDIGFWTKKRQVVNNSYDFNEHWKEIIEKFRVRIENYYFFPIDSIIASNKLRGEGFTILTIQCVLIEMFAAFKYGKIYKFDKRASDPNFTYRGSGDCLIPFLHSEEIFENHFYKFINGDKKKDYPFSAMEFYKKVRCGLMHEAQTKGEWIVNAKKTYQDDDVIFITKDSEKNKISIDRNILQKLLKIYFQDYLFNLSQESP
ncbi:MAG: hypothetical protein M0R38_10540 [Bacteroidia bacterium]|jgi:hypothetical protein|nr:hypothetical protein [Bacteroidia bacterium]